MNKLLLSVSLLTLASPAFATTYTVTDVAAVYPDNSGIIVVPSNPPPPWTTPMIFTTNTGQQLTVFCADLFHNVLIEGNQNLLYETAPVTTNGSGMSISEVVSNEMGQITRLGLIDASLGNMDGAIGAQGAIWQLEYGVSVTSPDPTVQSDLNAFVANTHDDGTGYAQGLMSLQGDQGMILPSTAIPESQTWVMLVLGFGFLGLKLMNKGVRS